ncbi:MAG: VCBS repeat-containing protein [Ignavibacteriota bacterium]
MLLPLAGATWCLRATAEAPAAIHFELKPIPFQLEHGEVAARHVPATMAGGVAVFDYNRDGRPDIFFTNGANLATLKKDDSKYRNRLFRNDGSGVFTDVTDTAGLAGAGFDSGAAVADYDNDGYPDLFVAGVHHNTLYHNNGDGTFTDVTEKSGISNLRDANSDRCGGLPECGWTSTTTACSTSSSSITCNGITPPSALRI